MEKLNDIFFYRLDKAIRTYRQFAQGALKAGGVRITVDQWLVLKTISDNPGVSQKIIAETVFKDEASVTRIIELLVKKDLLSRNLVENDRRKTILTVNPKTRTLLQKIGKIAVRNRSHALKGVSAGDVSTVRKVLDQISENCLTEARRRKKLKPAG
ncbi:MAG TPA: MarR family transcriptional regulator [Puia sp.]|nr:MarR family transcriptional regulator [Puia sp.]